jgi:hypothetical protein
MGKIIVKKEDANTFIVSVDDTTFKVTLTDDYHKKLTKQSKEELIEASFKFLLEREPKKAILKEFNLEIIKKYFPEYEEKIEKFI